MNIGQAIKKIRTEQKISQGEFAEKCGLSQTSMSQIESGKKRPSVSNLKKICEVLDIPETILYLYGMEESDVPEQKREVFNLLYPTVEDIIMKLVR
jgi:transcriptional regulator with XRE-family HTH domain